MRRRVGVGKRARRSPPSERRISGDANKKFNFAIILTEKRQVSRSYKDFLTHWLGVKGAAGLSVKTVASYREMAAHAMRDLGQKRLKALTTMDIQSFYSALVMERGLSLRTVNYVHTVLKMALNDAVDWGLLPGNPAAKARARAPRVRSQTLRVPTSEEVSRLLETARDTRWYPLWAWFIITGTRLGEALALQWVDIDWEAQMVTIRRAVSGDAGSRKVKTPKSESGYRKIALGSDLLAILREHRAAQEQLREVAGEDWQETDLVF